VPAGGAGKGVPEGSVGVGGRICKQVVVILCWCGVFVLTMNVNQR